MPSATDDEMLDLLRRDPSDANMHVYADALLGRGDSRGELVLLLHRDQTAPDTLDLDALERMMELVAEHGFIIIPDDPDADILRFRGGSTKTKPLTIVYRLDHGGHFYKVTDTPSKQTLVIERDNEVVCTCIRHELNFLFPETANVVLAMLSEMILDGRPWLDLELPTAAELKRDPNYRLGRFPTSPLSKDLVRKWPHARDWAIDMRDLDRWYALVKRHAALAKRQAR